jgi:predicted ATP-binding protein involved in virulence
MLPRDRIISEYADLYGAIPIKKLMRVYYDLFAFSHAEFRSDSLCIETLRQLKSFSFFPKDPDKNLGQIADYLAVALENFSFRMKLERGPINRDLLNSALMLYFDFYEKGLISDFDWQDIADLTHPNSYHDAFIKYKTQLKPTFKFMSSASHCYDKITYYTGHEHQLAAHKNLCQFISLIQKKGIVAQEDRELTRFGKVYQNAIINGISTVSLTNSFEVNKDRRLTLDDFDFSKARFVTSDELGDDDMEE